ncbi:MAG: TonB-dependent receptor [Edaphobacter sp.]
MQYVPDVYMRNQAPPALKNLLNAFPQQSPNGIDYGTQQAPSLAQFLQGYSAPGSIDSTSARLDQVFTPRFSSFFRFSYNPSSLTSRVLSALTSSEINSTSYTFGSTYAITDKVTDEFRIGYTRGNSITASNLDDFGNATPISLGSALNVLPDMGGDPEVFLTLSGVGHTSISTLNTQNIGRQWNVTNSIALNHNHHQLKFGVDYRRIETTIVNPTTESGAFYSSAQQVLTNASYYSYIERLLNSASIYNQFAAFGQDEWKLTPRLSLSLGLRWEVAPPPYSGNSTKPYVVLGDLTQPASLTISAPGASLWKTAWWNFAPRLGVAWQIRNAPGAETVLRAGGGLFFDTNNEAADLAFGTLGYQQGRENALRPNGGCQFLQGRILEDAARVGLRLVQQSE